MSLGQYGNPIIDPAPLHGASLERLDPKLIDADDLWRNIIRSKEKPSAEEISKFVSDMRVYQVLVNEGGGYRKWDLSTPSFDSPKVTIDPSGLLEVREGEQIAVSKDDRFYLRMVYHEDVNRFDKGAVIAVFEPGQAPSQYTPILAAELDTPMLVSGARWVVDKRDTTISPESIEGAFEPGVKFIRAGDNLWRYGYENGAFSAECRRHGGKPDQEWESMGASVFYKLTQQGLDTLLIPEPDLGKTLDLQKLGFLSQVGNATGIILWTATDGAPAIQRKSLTHLQNNGGSVKIAGSILEWTEAGKAARNFQIVEARSKPLTVGTAYDLYAVELTPGMQTNLPNRPVVHSVGEFDMVQAYRAAKELLKHR